MGRSNREVARRLGISPLTVACWRSRFRVLGLDGIRNDAPRIAVRRSLSEVKIREILAKTVRDVPPSGGRWSSRSLARVAGVSHSTVLRLWHRHHVQPRQTRLRLLGVDPRYRPRAFEIRGVYVSPPGRAVVIVDSPREPSKEPNRGAGRDPRVRSPLPADLASSAVERAELVRLLSRLETDATSRSAARFDRVEFLAFLDTVAARRAQGERIHMITAPVEPGLRDKVRSWGLRRNIALAETAEDGPFDKTVARWFADHPSPKPADLGRSDLGPLRQAVEQWFEESRTHPRPFAWVSRH